MLQVTFPDADRYDPSDYESYLEAVLESVRNAKSVKCTDVILRDAATIGPSEEYEDWSGGPKFDFGILTPSMGEVFGIGGDQVPPVRASQVASVWHVLSKAERRELWQSVSIAVGQVLGPEVDANAVLARTYILRVLQRAGHLENFDEQELFAKAAAIPLERAPHTPSELAEFAGLFR